MSAPDPGPNFAIIPGHRARIGDSAWDSSVGLWVDWHSGFGAAAFVARRKDAKGQVMTDKATLEEIRDHLRLIQTAVARGFGTDYMEGVAKSAIRDLDGLIAERTR